MTVGSSRFCSSPTTASAIALRMPGEGWVSVSERRSTTSSTLVEEGVAIRVGRRAAAEEAEPRAPGADLVASPGRDEDRASGPDARPLSVHLHLARPLEHDIELLRARVIVALGLLAGLELGLG